MSTAPIYGLNWALERQKWTSAADMIAHAKVWSIRSFAALRSSQYKCTMNAYKVQSHIGKTQVCACTFGFAPVQTQSLSYSNRFPLLRKTCFPPADRPAAVPCCTVKFA